MDRCAKFTLKTGGIDGVTKLCLSASQCANLAVICDAFKKNIPNLDYCKGICCSGDNCNNSPKNSPKNSSKNSQVMIGIIVFGVLAAIVLK